MRHLIELRRRENLFARIEEGRKKRAGLELILGTSEGRQFEMAEELRGIGRVTRVYETIPFLSLRTEPGEAAMLAGHVHPDLMAGRFSESFERTYRGVLEMISSVDASSRFRYRPCIRKGNVYSSIEFERLWNLDNIGAYDANQLSRGQGVKIAIIDTGIDYDHPDLEGRFEQSKGYDFVRDSHDPMDREGHGTHVAGTACSSRCGVSLDSTLYAIRVLDENGGGSEADIIAGIEYCIKNSMDVANMSLGSPDASGAFERICEKAYEAGLILVAAAGNEGYGADYPAAFGRSVIGVAAVDSENEHADFSNIWKTNDISAPGVDVLSCRLDGGYMEMSGTSMATPHVTGSMALALSLFKSEPREVENYMRETAQQLESGGEYDDDWVFGAGLVRADRLLSRIVSKASREYVGTRSGRF